MSKQTLRELAKDFAKGTISKEAYRKSRTDLIQGIISGKVAVNAIDYAPPLEPTNNVEEAITEGIKRDKTEVVAPEQRRKPQSNNATEPKNQNTNTKKNSKSPYIFIIVSAIIVLTLILAVILFYPKPPEPEAIVSTPDNSKISTATVSTTTNESLAGEILIGSFLSEKNWNEESLNKFVADWSALTQEQRDSSMETKRMKRMQATIYQQFLEGKALASIDAEKAIETQQALIEFANAIGITDTRLILE